MMEAMIPSLSDFGLRKTLKIRTQGRVRRSPAALPNLAHYSMNQTTNSHDDEEEDEHGSLPRFGLLRSIIPYSCFGGLPLGEVWWMN